MTDINIPELYDRWRDQARIGLLRKIAPDKMSFTGLGDAQEKLPNFFSSINDSVHPSKIHISAKFIELSKVVACHRNLDRWEKLYQLLWRLVYERKDLLNNPADPLVLNLLTYRKQVSRDRHKMTAFVRFREMTDGTFFAFYRPENFIVEYATDFFCKRFGNNIWSIATPHRTVSWDRKNLIYSSGILLDPFDASDRFEEMWCDYYRSIFNPARVSVSAMKNEMPVKYWSTMPETKYIKEMLLEAPSRVEQMKKAPVAAIVPDVNSLDQINLALNQCSACEIYKYGGAPSHGFGNQKAEIIVITEQSQSEKNKEILFKKVKLASLKLSDIYLTTVVKHSKLMNPHGVMRPTGSEVNCCKPWVLKEIEIIKPKVIVLCGTLAAQSILGRLVNIKEEYLKPHFRLNAQCFVIRDLEKMDGDKLNDSLIHILLKAKKIIDINRFIARL